ncbi:MAG: acyl-CoA dehydrogenase family protein [Archangiaceae bacterium]|nr:acyl-CoA dehydrogenase family protein [Archangiaceae bacterium]
MNFTLSPELSVLRARVRAFVDAEIIPHESELVSDPKRARLEALRAKARADGLWTPHLPRALGGLELGPMGMATLFREMGRSPIGAKIFHCDAPDQGNMDLLLSAATAAQQQRWLQPLVRGEITSAFSMTEPAPGAGADPSNLRTAAREVAGGFELSGAKWYSTGAKNAAFLIVMARTSDDPKTGATMFLVDRHAPGVRYERDIPVMAPDVLDHIEGQLTFDKVRLTAADVLGQVGDGFKLAQQRLVPARLTHCMRWLGLATRTLELCKGYLATRLSFGKELARHQAVQLKLAENATAIHAGNLMTFHCAWLLEQGLTREARPYSSMAKTHVARLLCQVLDDAIQLHGALGYSEDLPFSTWYRAARAARIADGPDEVHQITIARDFMLGRFELLV